MERSDSDRLIINLKKEIVSRGILEVEPNEADFILEYHLLDNYDHHNANIKNAFVAFSMRYAVSNEMFLYTQLFGKHSRRDGRAFSYQNFQRAIEKSLPLLEKDCEKLN